MDAKTMAKEKLEHIIAREGDANGERRKTYYLATLIEEIEESLLFSADCEDKCRGELCLL